MKVLITAGSTNVMIDKVRCISNIFKGRTGSEIARYFSYDGYSVSDDSFDIVNKHEVTLITSNPHHHLIENVKSLGVFRYKTYDELYGLMEMEVTSGHYDIIIHSAAVSDYKVEGTYIPHPKGYHGMQKLDSSKKISSSADELYLKLIPTEKIIDKIRTDWGFKGKLVKFKLQVGMTDKELLDIAINSMHHSDADVIVANCLEWAQERAFIVYNKDGKDHITECDRVNLSSKLYHILENIL